MRVPLAQLPIVQTARTAGRYALGPYTAVLLTDVSASGPISYDYLLSVRDEAGKDALWVSAEVSCDGTRCVGVFTDGGHLNYPFGEQIPHAETFKVLALGIVRDHLRVSEPVETHEETLGPNMAPEPAGTGSPFALVRALAPAETLESGTLLEREGDEEANVETVLVSSVQVVLGELDEGALRSLSTAGARLGESNSRAQGAVRLGGARLASLVAEELRRRESSRPTDR